MAEVQYNVWLDRGRFEEAEQVYQEHLTRLKYGGGSTDSSSAAASSVPTKSTLACEIARAREQIQKSLGSDTAVDSTILARIDALERENQNLKKTVQDLQDLTARLVSRVGTLEKGSSGIIAASPQAVTPAVSKPVNKEEKEEDDDEDDFELFDDNEEDEEERERIKQERVQAYEARKANKPVLIAKSNIILDVKPWDDETDMKKLEECVRSIEMDGLLWGASKLVPLAYGIKKLQISCVVEDDKVSVEDLEEKICSFEDYIQSMDIAAFNKI